WFQPYARVLMDQYMDTPLTALAVAGGREWRSSDEWKGGVRDDVGQWLPYQDVCGGTENEIFRDGQGPWMARTRPMVLTSSALLVVSAACCGVSRNGAELIAFRGLQGISNAIAVPASVSIISTRVQDGQPRNIGFSCLGFAAPLGFLLGLVLGGLFVDGVGWRPAFYLVAAASGATGLVGAWVLPNDDKPKSLQCIKKQLKDKIDWVGTIISSTGLVTVSYALATLSANVNNIKTATTISLLIVGIATIPAFVCWMKYQVKHNRPALIPNSFWRDF
ncbi:MFS general substrate transporter, partial [Aureobasidium melanogenum]